MKFVKGFFNNDLIRFIAISLLAIACFSGILTFSPVDVKDDLDGSWSYALVKTHELKSPIIIGKDVIYTYGPLGFLEYCVVLPSDQFNMNHWAKYLVNLTLLLITIFVLCMFARFAKGWIFWALIAVGFLYPVICTNSDIQWEQIGMLLAVLSATDLIQGHIKKFALLCLMALAVIGLFIKFSIGFHLFALLLLALGINYFLRLDRRFMFLIGGLYIIGVFVLWQTVAGGGLAALSIYLKEGLKISSNYSEYMIWDGIFKAMGLWLYIFPFSIIILNVFLGFEFGGIGLSSILAVNSFLLFKHGFVRADGHMLGFFAGQWYIVLCLASIRSKAIKNWRTNVLFVCLIIVCFVFYRAACSWCGPYPMFKPQSQVLTQLRYAENNINPHRSFYLAKEGSVNNFIELRAHHYELFKKLEKYCDPSQTITFIPWELCFAEQVKARWMPFPSLQFQASPPSSDFLRKDHELFSGASAPDLVVLSDRAVDDRSPTVEISHIIQDLLERYYVLDRADDFLILKKRAVKKIVALTNCNGDVFYDNSLVFIKADNIKINPIFAIQKLLFKGPQVTISITLKDYGKEAKWRIYTSQLEHGVYFNVPWVNVLDVFDKKGSIVSGPVAVDIIPETFANLCINKHPKLTVRICPIAPIVDLPVNRDAIAHKYLSELKNNAQKSPAVHFITYDTLFSHAPFTSRISVPKSVSSVGFSYGYRGDILKEKNASQETCHGAEFSVYAVYRDGNASCLFRKKINPFWDKRYTGEQKAQVQFDPKNIIALQFDILPIINNSYAWTYWGKIRFF